ncbi:MurJ-like flippase [Stieleria varia]|uniref:MurJ-like flippase n=2 Tax=Stieleria varia TaxID=2528005 RepID=A0A5C6AGF7_9BACT|nr:MurJ-like flippase [Stieleria varia]
MMVMLAMTIVQRGFGFFRGIWFCRLMDESQVGIWSMAFGFITMVTPIMLLGMPGALPRYVEHFRRRGHLTSLVRRVFLATVICTAVFVSAILIAPEWFGWLVFLEPQNTSLIYAVGFAVVAIIMFFFVNELVSSLRQVRAVSLMQFVQSVVFTVIGVAWLSFGGGLTGLVVAFAIATLCAALPGIWLLRRGWSSLQRSTEAFDAAAMWRRLLPYAAALWMMNLLANVFELSDRYMILHLSPGGEIAGQAAVGQYHSGRIIPMLLISLASMVSGVLMPYLTAEWEAGKREDVQRRLRGVLMGIVVAFTGGAAFALMIAPWLFSTLLQDRYSSGLALMPMAFVFCIWASLVTIAQNYLWVVEKGKLVGVALAIGLVANLSLNAILLPAFGLTGAVVATLLAHGIVMLGIWVAMWKTGYPVDWTMVHLSLLPATLLSNPWIALACVTFTLIVSPDAKGWLAVIAKRMPRYRLAWPIH